MRTIRCSETSVRNYRSTLDNITEESRSRLFHGETLKSRRPICIFIWTVGSIVSFETLIAADVHMGDF